MVNNLAFIATMTVLIDIKITPKTGLRRIPSEYKTPAASGIATNTYSKTNWCHHSRLFLI